MRRDGGWREDSTKAEEMTEERRRSRRRWGRKRVRGSAEETSKTSHCFSMPDLFRD